MNCNLVTDTVVKCNPVTDTVVNCNPVTDTAIFCVPTKLIRDLHIFLVRNTARSSRSVRHANGANRIFSFLMFSEGLQCLKDVFTMKTCLVYCYIIYLIIGT